jgi:hypothetical protein
MSLVLWARRHPQQTKSQVDNCRKDTGDNATVNLDFFNIYRFSRSANCVFSFARLFFDIADFICRSDNSRLELLDSERHCASHAFVFYSGIEMFADASLDAGALN